MLDLAIAIHRPLHFGEARGNVPNPLAFIADALQIGNCLDGGHDHAQVACGRSARRENAATLLVNGHLHAIDLVILARHGLAERTVLIEFDSFEQAVAAYESEAYEKALVALSDGVERDFRIIEGLD